MVRPYWLVRGKTSRSGEGLDVIAMVHSLRRAVPDRTDLEPEHLAVLQLCASPRSVADLASILKLPLAVVRIMLADLRDQGLVSVRRPRSDGHADLRLLREVADGLRRL